MPDAEQKPLFPPNERERIEEENRKAKELLEELVRNARNKVPPKPPILDDEGNEVPF